MKNGQLIDLTEEEIEKRNSDISEEEAKELADAPYRRLKEIDDLLNAKSSRTMEDLIKGEPVYSETQALFDEREAIRAELD